MTRIKGLFLGFAIGILLAMGAFVFISVELAFLIVITCAPVFTAIIGYVWGGIVQDKRKKAQQGIVQPNTNQL